MMLLLVMACTCNEEKMNVPINVEEQIQQFMQKEKFLPDDQFFYPGLGDRRLRLIITGKMNKAAQGFLKVAQSENVNPKMFHEEMDISLLQFKEFNLDSEEVERVCHYYEELMDIVDLESSDGRLNKFRYGFDPS